MEKRWRAVILWAWLTPVASALGAAACSGAPSPSGTGCTSNAECGVGEACVNRACEVSPGPDHGADAAARDSGSETCPSVVCDGKCCGDGQTCVNGACKTRVDCTRPLCGGACCTEKEICDQGTCKTPVCSNPGESCTTDCCAGAACISNDSLCHAKCTSNSQCNSGCCAPVQGAGYSVCAASTFCAPPKGLGDACTSGSQCASGRCVGWCTEACSSTNNACSGSHGGSHNEFGRYNWCVPTTSGSDVCFPECNTSADCAPYNNGTYCKAVTDANGYTEHVCST